MRTLGITSVSIGKENNLKIKAEEPVPIIFTFTRPLEKEETANIQIHIQEVKFDLNRTIGFFSVSAEQKEDCPWIIPTNPPLHESKPLELTFPEELAGATVNLFFSLQKDSTTMFENIDSNLLFKKVSVEILSSEGGPKIEAIYWCDSKEIRYGLLSSPRTEPLMKNETVYLHIHTRGLFGKQIECKCNATGTRIVEMRNNVAYEAFTFQDDLIDEIEMKCSFIKNSL